jgi:hypothetical protein
MGNRHVIKDFADAIFEERAAFVNGSEAHKRVELITAIYESGWCLRCLAKKIGEVFEWFVGTCFSTLAYVSNVRLDEAYLKPEACAKVYRVGRKKIGEMFTKEVSLPYPGCRG